MLWSFIFLRNNFLLSFNNSNYFILLRIFFQIKNFSMLFIKEQLAVVICSLLLLSYHKMWFLKVPQIVIPDGKNLRITVHINNRSK